MSPKFLFWILQNFLCFVRDKSLSTPNLASNVLHRFPYSLCKFMHKIISKVKYNAVYTIKSIVLNKRFSNISKI